MRGGRKHEQRVGWVQRWTLRFLLFFLFDINAVSQSFPLWGGLSPGEYRVGFKSLWQFDYSRTYNMTFEDGSVYAVDKAPRPILINIWYPAKAAPNAKGMSYREYLKIGSNDPRLEKFSSELVKYDKR